jgi:hypothetical protein
LVDPVRQLIERLTPALEQQGFYRLETKDNFVQDTPDYINMFVLYTSYTLLPSLSVHAAVQAKAVEAVVSEQLGRRRPLMGEATIGQDIRPGGVFSWVLNGPEAIPAVNAKLLEAFAAAQTFFSEHNSIPQIAEHLLRRPVYPTRSQKLLACAFLMRDRTLLDDIKQRLEDEFPPNAFHTGIQTELSAFQDLYRKLAQAMDEGGSLYC